MRLAGIRLKTNRICNTRLCQLQTIVRVIEIKEIDHVVRTSELAISEEKCRIMCDRLVKQLYRFKEILSLAGRVYSPFVDKFFRPQIQIVGSNIRSGSLIDRTLFLWR